MKINQSIGFSSKAKPDHRRVLISSIGPSSGGVVTMTAFIVKTLIVRGFEPVIAHYEPYSLSPHLSVPSYKVFQNSLGFELRKAYGECEAHAIGAWLPELEFTHYFATQYWRKLMDSCDAFISVSGNILPATPYQQTGRPYLAWVATDWEGDRKDRVQKFSLPRKVLDRVVNSPVIKILEKKILCSGNTLALSKYTADTLKQLTGETLNTTVLSMPVDIELFKQSADATIPGRIGFTGRIDDPRKNIRLILQAAALLKKNRPGVTVLLIGGNPTEEMLQQTDQLGLTGQISYIPNLSRADMCAKLKTLDVFVLPSYQEGLCISALEALSCGVPVVSTRCGGPEEFVIPGQTGILVDFDPNQMAHAIQTIIADRNLREHLSAGARRLIEDKYTSAGAENIFWNAFYSTFPHLNQNGE
jgi:glycosyltransferase involved in cell wall biosynthesis